MMKLNLSLLLACVTVALTAVAQPTSVSLTDDARHQTSTVTAVTHDILRVEVTPCPPPTPLLKEGETVPTLLSEAALKAVAPSGRVSRQEWLGGDGLVGGLVQ